MPTPDLNSSLQETAIRFVIFHRPGPAWQPRVEVLAQPGVFAHFQYLNAAFADGKIELAGPFLSENAGGMAILSAACTEQDARALAEADPAVKSGLIHAEVRPWMTTLARRAR